MDVSMIASINPNHTATLWKIGNGRVVPADLRGAITCGALRPGDKLPPMANLAARYGVSFGTAQRAVAELRAEGLVSVCRGQRAVVVDPAKAASADVVPFACRRDVIL
jgi:DNA-binding GntR family transcriptional regulator